MSYDQKREQDEGEAFFERALSESTNPAVADLLNTYQGRELAAQIQQRATTYASLHRNYADKVEHVRQQKAAKHREKGLTEAQALNLADQEITNEAILTAASGGDPVREMELNTAKRHGWKDGQNIKEKPLSEILSGDDSDPEWDAMTEADAKETGVRVHNNSVSNY